jgi:hypothetical protein
MMLTQNGTTFSEHIQNCAEPFQPCAQRRATTSPTALDWILCAQHQAATISTAHPGTQESHTIWDGLSMTRPTSQSCVVAAFFRSSSLSRDHRRMASITHHDDCVGMRRDSSKPAAAKSC